MHYLFAPSTLIYMLPFLFNSGTDWLSSYSEFGDWLPFNRFGLLTWLV